MRQPEQIPYGVKDFKRIRLEGRHYADTTANVRKMMGDLFSEACVGKGALCDFAFGIRMCDVNDSDAALAGVTPGRFICCEFKWRNLVRLEEVARA